MKNFGPYFLLFFASSLLFSSCLKDPSHPDPVYNETELITSVILTLKDSLNPSDSTKVKFRDPDGEGGNAPLQFDSIELKNQHHYIVRLSLLDETKKPPGIISDDVKEEAAQHQFFFNVLDADLLTINYLDKDKNGMPVGLLSAWHTIKTGSGKIKIVLKHLSEAKTGMQAAGDTDVEVIFKLRVL